MNPSAACGSNTCVYDPSLNGNDCDKTGNVDIFMACSAYNDCAPGMACVSYYGKPECEPWCRVGTNSDCPAYTYCVDVYGSSAPKQGTARLGHCQ
jgi:hypothetical protein